MRITPTLTIALVFALTLPACSKIRRLIHPPTPVARPSSTPAADPAASASPTAADPIIQVITLADASCALYTSGRVRCWGDNQWGLMGAESAQLARIPVTVFPVGSEITSIAGSAHHACGVKKNGRVFCWGNNFLRQLGLQSPEDRHPPKSTAPITPPLSDSAKQVTTGEGHSCALLNAGTVQCWGSNVAGQLGDGGIPARVGYTQNGEGNAISRWKPADVKNLEPSKAIAAAEARSCALTTQGKVFCWGRDPGLQQSSVKLPMEVIGLQSSAESIAVGAEHYCALLSGASMACWGSNRTGSLGDGSKRDERTPKTPQGLSSGVTAIGAGGETSCAVHLGQAKCWGANGAGQVGNGSMAPVLVPTLVKGLPQGVRQIAPSTNHTCALLETGAVYCWGSNGYGQLGDGGGNDRLEATPVIGL